MICALMIVTILVIEVPKDVSAQVTEEWVAKYNGPDNFYDITYSMIVDSYGNVYVTGGSRSYDGENYTTVKYDTNGNELWVAYYNGPANKHGHANDITVDSLGNVYVTGKSDGTTSRWDCATIKYDPNGNEIWVKRYNGGDDDIAYAITADTQGNIYITGHTDDKYNTIKYDANGNQIWNSKYEGSSGEAMDIVVDDLSGNVYVFGRTETDLTTVAYDQDGNELWIKKYGSCYYFSPRSRYIVVDSLGNVYVVGTTKGSGTSHDFTTIKYDSLGNEIWVAKYNSPGNGIDQAFGIDLDSSGNVYVTGCSYFPSPTYREYATVKYDQNGNEIWVANYGYGSGRGIRVDDSLGFIYVTGTYSNGSIATMTTIAYDQDGNELWVGNYNGPGGEDKGIFIDVDASGNVYVSGYSKGNETYTDFCTIKYSPKEQIPDANIDIDPNTLNLKSKGRWITCYITLNEPNDVNEIDISTILLEDTIPAEWGDIQGDTLMVKFDRSEVEDMLVPGTYNLKVTGELLDGTGFEGFSDEVRVIEP